MIWLHHVLAVLVDCFASAAAAATVLASLALVAYFPSPCEAHPTRRLGLCSPSLLKCKLAVHAHERIRGALGLIWSTNLRMLCSTFFIFFLFFLFFFFSGNFLFTWPTENHTPPRTTTIQLTHIFTLYTALFLWKEATEKEKVNTTMDENRDDLIASLKKSYPKRLSKE